MNWIKRQFKKVWVGIVAFAIFIGGLFGLGVIDISPGAPLETPYVCDLQLPPVTPLVAQLALADGKDRASIKGCEIAKIGSVAKQRVQFSGADYDIEITLITPIEGGVELLARAWNPDGSQIGFGKDGTVDLERFRIINPPIMALDPTGDYKRFDEEGNVTGVYKEDLKETLLQVLSHTISIKTQVFDGSKIIQDKIGNTTLIAFPLAGSGTAPMDAEFRRDPASEIFSTIQSGSGTVNATTGGSSRHASLLASTTTDEYTLLIRGGLGFDTSSIASDSIDSAKVSLFMKNIVTALGDTDVDLVDFDPADSANYADGDHGNFTTTIWATSLVLSTITDEQYNDWTFNATGEAGIDKSGITDIGFRLDWDTDNSFGGTWASSGDSGIFADTADVAGTSTDPKMTVEHSVGGNPRRVIID